MARAALLFLCSLLTLALPAADQGVEDLIQQLGDPEFEVRARSVKEISRQNFSIMPQLEAAQAKTEDIEVKSRLTGLIIAFAIQHRQERAFPDGTWLDADSEKEAKAAMAVLKRNGDAAYRAIVKELDAGGWVRPLAAIQMLEEYPKHYEEFKEKLKGLAADVDGNELKLAATHIQLQFKDYEDSWFEYLYDDEIAQMAYTKCEPLRKCLQEIMEDQKKFFTEFEKKKDKLEPHEAEALLAFLSASRLLKPKLNIPEIFFKDESIAVRNVALTLALYTGPADPKYLPLLKQLAADRGGEKEGREACAELFGLMGSLARDATPQLLEWLNANPELPTIEALGMIGTTTPEVIHALVQVSTRERLPRLCKRALLKALERLNADTPEVRTLVERYAKSSDYLLRWQAVQLLKKLK